MKESEERRIKIVNRLMSITISQKREIEDILKLTAIICKTPVVLVTLLDDEKQYIKYNIGFNEKEIPLNDAFCRYTIQHDAVMEVQDSRDDDRFKDNPLVTGGPGIRFYAGAPLNMKDGGNIGALCAINTRPQQLDDEQKQMLQILSHQITTILEFELSLKVLKEEILKVQQSEMKLKCIFQSSPTCHFLLDQHKTLLAFNKSAYYFVEKVNKKQLKEGTCIEEFYSAGYTQVFRKHFHVAMQGSHTSMEQKLSYPGLGDLWWQIDYNPVYDHNNKIIGVSVDATNITERLQQQKSILEKSEALRKIAHIQSHELRRPVANILGLVNYIKEKQDAVPDENFMQYLEKETLALDEKVHQIVEMTR